MIPTTEDRFDRSAGALAEEETLGIIAMLPAPAGLEDRIKAGIHSAPRRGMVIAWPFESPRNWIHSTGMRVAAAAAIVVAVAGGGWGVYSHIQVAPVPSAFVDPQLPNGAGRFSTAGAMHVPQTVEGPIVASPVPEKKVQETGKSSQKSPPISAKKSKAGGSNSATHEEPVR